MNGNTPSNHTASKYAIVVALIIPFLTTGCASVSGSTQQRISVQTINDNKEFRGAECTLSNNYGDWKINTPDEIVIRKSSTPLAIICNDKDNVYGGKETLLSSASTSMWGNIFLGGVVGAALDGASSSGFDYPTHVIVFLRKIAN